ncbi:RNA-guided endonuclease InsQ/TnpB family protein [Pelistega europaea]|uniref:RNA-guided endonuclease InsQ/TnpB family protein n=1 Tax=Pelistega europaea TaxID=106147 RepID=UPI001C10F1D6
MERAFRNFFAKRADFPKFKRKGIKDSFRFPQGFKVEQQNGRVYLPKIGWVRYRNSQAIVGELKNITVSQRCGKWYVSIQTEWETQTPTPKGGEMGIDMGVVRFATLSTGQYFEPIHAFKILKGQLAKLQKQFKNKKLAKTTQLCMWIIQDTKTYLRTILCLNYLRSSATKWTEFRRQLDYKLHWNEPDTKTYLRTILCLNYLRSSATKWAEFCRQPRL